MKADTGSPDPSPPGVRVLIYSVFCWMNRHPRVWRAIGSALRFWPFLSRVVPVAATRTAVKAMLMRTRSFSNTSHVPNLVADAFLIGMDPGETYEADRALFESILDLLDVEKDAHREAQARVAALKSRGSGEPFDLIDDYLMWVVFSAIKPAFGAAADGVVAGSRETTPDEATQRRYLNEIRPVAAQLFAGRWAPVHVQRRAEVNATSLKARIRKMTLELGMSWPQARTMPYSAIRRNAIGLAWVSHPVTVQSGALMFKELLGRPAVYRVLREAAQALGTRAWTDEHFRTRVANHVLELMRFRPIFPLLARDVPRATEFESGARRNPKCPAGTSATVLSISALFDPYRVPTASQFCPHRRWGSEEETRYLMFGYGPRQCPAKDHAVTILTSALIGLLTLPELRWADRWGARMGYDGPMICRMRLLQAQHRTQEPHAHRS